MPSVGFCLFAVLGVNAIFQMNKSEKANRLAFSVITAACLIFGLLTINRNTAWKDNFTLFTTDIKVSKNSAKLNNAVAGELITRNATRLPDQRNKDELTTAVEHLNKAVGIHPNYKNAFLLLGNAHNYLQNYEQSIGYYNRALQIDPGYADANSNLAITYREAGQFFGEKQGNLPKSIEYLTKANSMTPNDPEIVRLLGVANGMAGNHAQAISFFKKQTLLEPNNAKAFYNLGSAFYHGGMIDSTNLYHAKARAINSNIENEMRR